MLVASKWQALGEALSLDEDRLDEIYTNNEADEACLHEMLEHYMMRTDLQHSWEEVATALKKIGEETTVKLAEAIPCRLNLMTAACIMFGESAAGSLMEHSVNKYRYTSLCTCTWLIMAGALLGCVSVNGHMS